MSEFSVKYRGNSFEDWYKANYNGATYDPKKGFQRGAEMNDADWAIGQSLYNSYTAKNNRKSQYDSSVSELERLYGTNTATLEADRDRSLREASFTHELMQKYLPEQIKARGLSGSGVSESTLLSAYSTYANNRGNINADYAKNKTALDNEYQSDLTDLATDYGNDMTDLETGATDDVTKIFDKYRTDYESREEKLFDDAKEKIGLLGTIDYDAMNEYIDGLEGFDEPTKKRLKEYGTAVVKSNIENRRLEGENVDDVNVDNQYRSQFKAQGSAFDMDALEANSSVSLDVKKEIATQYNDLIKTSGAGFFNGCADVHERWKRYTDAIWSGLVSEESKILLTEALKQVDPALYRQKAAEGKLFGVGKPAEEPVPSNPNWLNDFVANNMLFKYN